MTALHLHRTPRIEGAAACALVVAGMAGFVIAAMTNAACAEQTRPRADDPRGPTVIYGQPGSPIPLSPSPPLDPDVSARPVPYGDPPVHDTMLFWHVLFNQLEGRTNGSETSLRWDGEAWAGTDYNRVWVKTEGFVNEEGTVEDGIHEVLYDRPIPVLRYFDWQAGLRYDLDSTPARPWSAIGIEGLAPGFFEVEGTLYVRDAGHVAARLNGSYDLLLTNRLIAQPQIEMNFYSKDDPERATGSGLAEIDTGLRVRYEITRKFGPYVGVAYTGRFGDTATFARREGEDAHVVRFIFGIRLWY